MRLTTLLHYLVGDRQAILKLAASRWSLVVGLLFVLSAAFAREYDAHDLAAEPWHVAMPLFASLLASFILFCVVTRFGRSLNKPPSPDSETATAESEPERMTFLSAYASFLGLFWLTAPLAWLYAVPYERFLSPLDAAKANLATLGVVAVWRVFLMVRVTIVLLNYRPLAACLLVAVVADLIVVVGLAIPNVNLIVAMGGIHYLSESDELVEGVSASIGLCGYNGFLFLLVAAIVKNIKERPRWQAGAAHWGWTAMPGAGVLILSVAALAIWPFVLPHTQPEQQLRTRVELAFRQGRIAEALAEMSAHEPADFPPHWDPPPHAFPPSHPFGNPDLLLIGWELQSRQPAAWVRQVYIEKLRERLCQIDFLRENELAYVVELLSCVQEGPALLMAIETDGQKEFVKELREFLQKKSSGAAPLPNSK